MSKRHALRYEAANSQRIRVLVSTELHRSGPRSKVANRHAGRLTRLHVGVTHVKQAQLPFRVPRWTRGAPGHPSGPGSRGCYSSPLSLAVLDHVGPRRDDAVTFD